MENEVWKDIEGYEGMYQVSSFGRVKGVDRFTYNNKIWKGKILKTHIVKNYEQVVLCKNGKCKNFKVHRLVAQAFISNPSNLSEVNHKDENKLNNCVNNLEWCSVLYNNTYCDRHKKIGEKLHKPIFQYSIDGKFLKRYDSVMDASRLSGLNRGQLSKCARGEHYYKTAGGYIWKYE